MYQVYIVQDCLVSVVDGFASEDAACDFAQIMEQEIKDSNAECHVVEVQ
jgi:hypothetical protein